MKAIPANHMNPNPFQAGRPSPLRRLPFGSAPNPAKYCMIDPAHTFAIDGIGKDFLASTIVMLTRMGHFGDGSINHNFQVAYSRFIAWLNANKKSTSISEFSCGTLKLPQNSTLVGFNWHDLLFKRFFGTTMKVAVLRTALPRHVKV